MTPRALETILAAYTAFTLVVYIPLETLASLGGGLLNPFYLVDVIAMMLLLGGVIVSLRARPIPAPSLLCVGYAWSSANAWRATFSRVEMIERGEALQYGPLEFWTMAIATALSLIVFVVLLALIARNDKGH